MRLSSQATQISRNKLLLHSGLILTGALCIPVAQATTYDFSTIAMPAPGPFGIQTTVRSINDNGAIVGDSGGSGFLYNGGMVTPINAPVGPNSSNTYVNRINSCSEGSSNCINTYVTGINNSGEIIGSYNSINVIGATVDANFTDMNGSFTTIAAPKAYGSPSVSGINNHGDIVGNYVAPTSNPYPFFQGYVLSGNQYTTINFTNNTGNTGNTGFSFNTFANGINDQGVVVGQYSDRYSSSPNPDYHGFVKNGGTYTTLDAPGQRGTIALGINNNGAIVGAYNAPSIGYVGFVDNGGNYTALKVPGAYSTIAYGINDKGIIVGSYDTNQGQFGFMATPVPEPSVLAQLGVGLVMMVSLQYWRRRNS